MEHSDLVAEMAQVEHLTTQERLHLARRRRMQQLKLWTQREKEWLRNRPKKEKSTKRNIYFSDSVMLLEAAARNDIDEVRRLLQRGVTPDATNEDGLTALHQCCIDNNEAMMRLLLEHGADVNAEDSERWTPLHAAATCGNLHLVRVLIQRGADLLAVNGDGNMPYDICEDEATLDAIEGEMAARGVTQRLIDETRAATELRMLRDVHNLLRADADLDEQRDTQGATLLHIASANGYLKVAELLLENRAATDVMDQDMWRPVHAAACWGHLEILDLLFQYGADLNVRNKHDETPADICEDSEMRGRIIRLATEQEESRRRAQAAAVRHAGSGSSERLRGARRSSSTASSSRVRSVRRTSLREKQLAAKQDARGEARLRENFDASDTTQQGFSNGVENDQNVLNQMKNGDVPQKRSSTSSTVSNQSSNDSGDEYGSQKQILQNGHKPPNNAELSENNHHIYNQTKNANPLYGVNAASQYAPAPIQSQLYSKSDNISSDTLQSSMKDISKNYLDNKDNRVINGNPMPNGIRKAPEGQDNDSYVHEDEADGRKESVLGGNQLALSETGSATHYTTDNNGKINVHVTVMINAGTLADLKKQRSQIRTNGSPVESHAHHPTNNSLSADTATPGAATDALPLQMNPHTLSPSGTVPRFTGNTGEVVGDARSNRCCIIM